MIGRLLVAATFALAVTACSDTSVQPTETSEIANPSFAAGGNSGPSASGAGHFEITGDLRTFSFHANTAKDGSVSGQAQLNNRDQSVAAHIVVDCLRIDGTGTTAYVSGVISKHSDPTLVGKGARWKVQDNGEGANAPPDLITLAHVGFTASPTACLAPLSLTLNAIAGNIQVKP